MELITTAGQATPTWLTHTLSTAGILPAGEVTALRQHPNDAFNSAITHLEVSYSAGAPAAAPCRLLLKINHDHAGRREAHFYQLAATLPRPLPAVVPCYAAAYDPASGLSCCLLADLSATHAAPVTRRQLLALEGVPAGSHLDGMIDALAHFHAFWWDHPLLGHVPDVTELRWWYSDQAHHERHVARRQQEWQQFVAAAGGRLPAGWRQLYQQALARLPQLWERYLAPRLAGRRHLTLTNGDCYFNQFLCPLPPGNGPTYLVDFQDVSANFGAYDLVYLLATFWTPAQRQQHEERLLRRYHQQLQAHGLTAYTWEELRRDYRLMIAYMIFDPIWNQTAGSSPAYWQPKMACLVSAYEELACAEL
ncbi:MAG: aminoglycoside phosphotransferase family protein [Chloroflexi bacterium]|nr:aminoglycoside phosphotransferase family protein [Chloroflexota bacterium]MCI0580559.1 aminoglycoside phosphotransferase family protein [Chloroflexota bacterium]MCI0644933.1 aminoglycoside phosphotransferase family protein [Chloroflexota bacterium]MCI0731162.1 aminoglycoside phosphotransferase family protein [Chloroflexota bacterium]